MCLCLKNKITSIERCFNIFRNIQFSQRALCYDNYPKCLFKQQVKHFSHDDNSDDRLGNINGLTKNFKNVDTKHVKNPPAAVASKYQVFRDEDSPIVLDVEEERNKILQSLEAEDEHKPDDEFMGLSLERGLHGVFDIEELIEVLRKDKAQDIFVASIPLHFKYVDYIVVVNGKSYRHMLALAEFIRKAYKRKRHTSDIIPRIEGEASKDWIALDLGNIALHIFSKDARPVYDLESLWSVGSQYDALCNKPDDPVLALLQRHAVYLGDLQPAETQG